MLFLLDAVGQSTTHPSLLMDDGSGFKLHLQHPRTPLAISSNAGGQNTPPTVPSSTPGALPHQSEKHPLSLLTNMNQLQKRRELCDVVLLVGNKRILAHRVVLSACSPYFHAMFTSELIETRRTEVPILDIDDVAMELLVNFCYSSEITIEENNVQVLLPAACLLQMNEIQDICCEFLKQQLHPSNCLGIRSFADTHACRELLRVADKFTQLNFQEVMESEEFLELPVNQLIDIIRSDEVNVRSEEQVFNAVMTWVKYNIADRRPHLSQVLEHVRLPLLTPKFLVGTVGSDLLIKSDEGCRDLVDEAKNYLLLPQERPLMQGPRTRPRKPIKSGQVLFAVGGVVQWRRHSQRGKVRAKLVRVAFGNPYEQETVWCGCGCTCRSTVRCGWARWAELPEQCGRGMTLRPTSGRVRLPPPVRVAPVSV